MTALALLACAGAACRQDMHDQPKYKPFRESEIFADRRSARPFVPGTVARGTLRENAVFYTGKVGNDFVTEIPMNVTAELLARGQEVFNIHCAACHSKVGDGNGVAKRIGAMAVVANLHDKRIVELADGELFNTVSHGKNLMQGYAGSMPVEDRWASIAYLRALQLSRLGTLEDVPEAARGTLKK